MGIPENNEVRLSTRASKWIWLGLAIVVIVAGALIYLAVTDGDEEEETTTTNNSAGGLQVLDPWVRAPVPQMAGTEEAQMAATEVVGTEEAPMDATQEGEPGDVSMAMTGAANMTAAYMAIANDSGEDDRLLSVTADVAGRVEIHETTIENEIAQMRPLPSGLPIAAGQTVELSPGGVHLMLLDLNTDLAPGMMVTLTLNFSSGAQITVSAPVQIPEE